MTLSKKIMILVILISISISTLPMTLGIQRGNLLASKIKPTLQVDISNLLIQASRFDADGDLFSDDLKILENKTYDVIFLLRSLPKWTLEKINEMGITIGGIYTKVIQGFNVKGITLSQLKELRRVFSNHIILIENNSIRQLCMDRALIMTGIRPYLWRLNITFDRPIAVAIVDTGVDSTHTDLTNKVIYWKDLTEENFSYPVDLHGHGTMIASIIAGDGKASSRGLVPITSYGIINNKSRAIFSIDVPLRQTISINVSWTSEDIAERIFLRIISENKTDIISFNSSQSSVIKEITLNSGFYKILARSDKGYAKYVLRIKMNRSRSDAYPPMKGINSNLKLAVFKIFEAGEITTNDNLILEALDEIAYLSKELNIMVINLSLGGYTPSLSLDTAINNLAQQGILTIVAAGNLYAELYPQVTERQIGSPGTAAYAITVGGANDYFGITIYSSRGGSYTNGINLPYIKPDLITPSGGLVYGSWIVAAESNANDDDFNDYPNDYTGALGTSFAAPIITGLAATLIGMLANNNKWYWNLSSILFIKYVILSSTFETTYIGRHETHLSLGDKVVMRDKPSFDFGKKDFDEGFGFIHAPAAVLALMNIYSLTKRGNVLEFRVNMTGSPGEENFVRVFLIYLDGCYRIRVNYKEKKSSYILGIYEMKGWEGSPVLDDYLHQNKREITIRGNNLYALVLKPRNLNSSGVIDITIEKIFCISPLTYVYVCTLALIFVTVIAISTIKRRLSNRETK